MFRHRRVGGIGEAELLETERSLPLGLGAGRHGGEEALDEELLDLGALQLALERAADDLAASTEHCHGSRR